MLEHELCSADHNTLYLLGITAHTTSAGMNRAFVYPTQKFKLHLLCALYKMNMWGIPNNPSPIFLH